MTDAAKKKIAGTVGASKAQSPKNTQSPKSASSEKSAKNSKGPTAVTTDITDPSLDYISAMLLRPSLVPRLRSFRTRSQPSLLASMRQKSSAAA